MSTESDFKFDNDEWVLVDGVLGQITHTAFTSKNPDSYLVVFSNGSRRWFYEDMISKTRKH